MAIHHVVTILLMSFSWWWVESAVCILDLSFVACSQGYWRIGSLVLIIHDISDIFLEGAKTLKYLKVGLFCLLVSNEGQLTYVFGF